MPRQSHSTLDYKRLAHSKGLEFIDDRAPESIKAACNWKCRNCGKEMYKAYRSVYLAKHGCSCQLEVVLGYDQYVALADKLGIEWVPGEYLPANTKQDTLWRGRTGEVVSASYYQLAYGNIPRRIRNRLGIDGS